MTLGRRDAVEESREARRGRADCLRPSASRPPLAPEPGSAAAAARSRGGSQFPLVSLTRPPPGGGGAAGGSVSSGGR